MGRSGITSTTAAGGSNGNGNGSYQIGLLFEAQIYDTDGKRGGGGKPAAPCSSPIDFVCSSSGVGGVKQEDRGGGVGFDRVCALRGKIIHIFTFHHDASGDISRDCAGKFQTLYLQGNTNDMLKYLQ